MLRVRLGANGIVMPVPQGCKWGYLRAHFVDEKRLASGSEQPGQRDNFRIGNCVGRQACGK